MTESNSLEFDHFLSQEYNSDEEINYNSSNEICSITNDTIINNSIINTNDTIINTNNINLDDIQNIIINLPFNTSFQFRLNLISQIHNDYNHINNTNTNFLVTFNIHSVPIINNKKNEIIKRKKLIKQNSSYKKINKNDNLLCSNSKCTICLDKYKEGEFKRELPKCNHIFHKKCIDPWLLHSKKMDCPICRKKF